jgi:hypothetical protein
VIREPRLVIAGGAVIRLAAALHALFEGKLPAT